MIRIALLIKDMKDTYTRYLQVELTLFNIIRDMPKDMGPESLRYKISSYLVATLRWHYHEVLSALTFTLIEEDATDVNPTKTRGWEHYTPAYEY